MNFNPIEIELLSLYSPHINKPMLSITFEERQLTNNDTIAFDQLEDINIEFNPPDDGSNYTIIMYQFNINDPLQHINFLTINNDDELFEFDFEDKPFTVNYSCDVYLQQKELKFKLDSREANIEELMIDNFLTLTERINFKVIPHSFPYKRVFLNPDQLWSNAVNNTYTTVKEITVPIDSKGWRSIPKRIKWLYNGKSLAVVISEEAYENVNVLTDYFSEKPRMNARRFDCVSPFDFYRNNYEVVENKAIELMNKSKNNNNNNIDFRFYLREAVYHLIPECTTFSVVLYKAILTFFGSKRVLDPSSGWGDRILGAASTSSVQIYHGADPNTSLRKSYDDITDFIYSKGVQGEYKIVSDSFLNIDVKPNFYDIVFTSPPYYDYEIYSNDPKQSIQGRTTVDDWLNDFFFPYLSKAWDGLKYNGVFALYITNTRSGRFVDQMLGFVNKKLRGRFNGVIAVTNDKLDHGYPIWVWRKK